MSIIHDALKKVQQMNNTGASLPQAPFPQPEPAPGPEPRGEKMNIPLLVAAVCAVVAMVFAALPQLTARKAQAPAPAAAPAPRQEQPAPRPVAEAPRAPSERSMSEGVASAVTPPALSAMKPPVQRIIDPNDPLSSIQVEGVMDMEGRKVVLINGNIYEEGQTIYGHIISEITFESLTIIENGRKRIFPSKP